MLYLFDGESFANIENQGFSTSSNSIPYRRETFGAKEILIDFDSDFNRYDESILQDQHISKNIKHLSISIDSASKVVVQRQNEQAAEMVQRRYFGRELAWNRSLETGENIRPENYNSDSLFYKLDKPQMEMAMTIAMQKATEMKGQIEFQKLNLGEATLYVSRHEIEWHRKFTLSFACLIFFFIGAPLGAIIRKGGLGAPVVISVVMFIIYYIIDNTGYKMAREGLWTALQGMWLSSSILLPVGIFLTYNAAVDAVLFNTEEYMKVMQKIRTFIEVKILRMNNKSN